MTDFLQFFLDFYSSVFTELIYDWPLGGIVAILVIVLTIAVIGLIIRALLLVIDSWFLPKKEALGVIDSKTFTPAATTLQYDVAVKAPMPVTSAPEWSVDITIGDKSSSILIEREDFRNLKKGDNVRAIYAVGRFSRKLYLKSFRKI